MSDSSYCKHMVVSSAKETRNSTCNGSRSKPKKTSFRIQQIINDIGKLLSAGRLDREIMEQLQIKRSQYYEYKSRLFQQSGELFERLNEQNEYSLIYHKELLSERLTRLFNRAELDLAQKTYIEGNNNRASVLLAAQNIAINIFKLESEGLRILANGHGRQLRNPLAEYEKRNIDPTVDKAENDESEIY